MRGRGVGVQLYLHIRGHVYLHVCLWKFLRCLYPPRCFLASAACTCSGNRPLSTTLPKSPAPQTLPSSNLQDTHINALTGCTHPTSHSLPPPLCVPSTCLFSLWPLQGSSPVCSFEQHRMMVISPGGTGTKLPSKRPRSPAPMGCWPRRLATSIPELMLEPRRLFESMRSDKPVDYVTDKEAGVAQELEDFFGDCSCWGLEPAEPQGGMFGSYHTVAVVPQYAGTY
jgi:hypothetical protein